MKYRNASEILPDDLLKELQRYASGEMLYIPSGKERKEWGAGTGARQFFEQRNAEIRHAYFHLHISIEALCTKYNLSDETIRKILYR